MLLRDLVLVFVGTGFGIVLRDLCAPLLASLRRPPTLPQPVNMFRGTVFPAPHDPRWQLVAANCPGGIYFFGDRDISVSRGGLLVGDVIISADTKVAEYHAAIERAQAERAAEEALVCVEPAILGAGYRTVFARVGETKDQAGAELARR